MKKNELLSKSNDLEVYPDVVEILKTNPEVFECNWKNLKERKIELEVLPWGAAEAPNYQPPYSTDVIESEKFSAEAVKNN